MLPRNPSFENMIPDRENLCLVGGKKSSTSSANEWLDSRSEEEQTITRNEENYSEDAFEDTEIPINSSQSSEEDEKQNEDHILADQNKMALAPTNFSISKPTNNIKTSLLEAKRARVENIVTSIKVNPSRQQGLDLSQFRAAPVQESEEKIGQSSEEIQRGFRKRNAADDLKQLENHILLLEKSRLVQKPSRDESINSDEFCKKRPRMDDDFYGANLSKSQIRDGFNFQSDNQENENSFQNGYVPDKTYKVLVSSLKQELLSELDKLAEKSAKRVLDELKKTVRDFQSLEKNQTFWHYFEQKDISNFNRYKNLKNFTNAMTAKSENKTSSISKQDFAQDNTSSNSFRGKTENFPVLTPKSFQRFQTFQAEAKFQNSREKSKTPTVNEDKNGEQVEALSLVKKKNLPPSPYQTSTSPSRSKFSNTFSPKYTKNIAEQFQKTLLKSISPSIQRKQFSNFSRTPSPPRNGGFHKSMHLSNLSDSAFHTSNANPYRIPFHNNSLLSSTLQRDSIGSASLLRNPFSYNSSMYPTAVHPQSGFPFSANNLSLPFLQSLQHQRNLAHAIADYNKLNDAGDSANGRSSSTRTSTREPTRMSGYSAKEQESKPDPMRYVSPSGLSLNQFSTSSAQDSLTPLHLKKAKIMFFYTRYPSANTLKTYFPDVKFSRATTSQLIKWFSNFREFFYIQIEKFARQALSEGVTDIEQLTVTKDSELFRVLNLHYNKCNDFRVPNEFLGVTLSSLEEFFSAIEQGKDEDPSWKKPIYKIICKLDQDIPVQFKSPNVLERLSEIH